MYSLLTFLSPVVYSCDVHTKATVGPIHVCNVLGAIMVDDAQKLNLDINNTKRKRYSRGHRSSKRTEATQRLNEPFKAQYGTRNGLQTHVLSLYDRRAFHPVPVHVAAIRDGDRTASAFVTLRSQVQ